MSSYAYEAVDAGGLRNKGTLDVIDQGEASGALRKWGCFPPWSAPSPRRRGNIQCQFANHGSFPCN